MTNVTEFVEWGHRMLEWIANYRTNLQQLPVTSSVEPGYIRNLIPDRPPEQPEPWVNIMQDVDRVIVPGLTHWQHPRFHAFFPNGASYASIIADMLSAALAAVGFSWASCPALTELEYVMLDWVADMFDLPQHFRNTSEQGGGVIEGSASDCVMLAMLTARRLACQKRNGLDLVLRKDRKSAGEFYSVNRPLDTLSRLVVYTSSLSHCCVMKAAALSLVNLHVINVDDDPDYALRGPALQKAMEMDIERGLIPFFVSATLGTTACCSFDDIESIGPVCKQFGVWLHVDGAYAGNALICPEFRYIKKGFEYVDSFNVNPNKWLLIGFDCSLFWIRDQKALTETMMVDTIYLNHKHAERESGICHDLRHWSIALSRRFRSMKLWFVIRSYGAQGLRNYIRQHVKMARLFTKLIICDQRFELVGRPKTGLVCFRLKGPDALTQSLSNAIDESRQIMLTPATVGNQFFLRFAVCYENPTHDQIYTSVNIISQLAHQVLYAYKSALCPPTGQANYTWYFNRLQFTDSMHKKLRPRPPSTYYRSLIGYHDQGQAMKEMTIQEEELPTDDDASSVTGMSVIIDNYQDQNFAVLGEEETSSGLSSASSASLHVDITPSSSRSRSPRQEEDEVVDEEIDEMSKSQPPVKRDSVDSAVEMSSPCPTTASELANLQDEGSNKSNKSSSSSQEHCSSVRFEVDCGSSDDATESSERSDEGQDVVDGVENKGEETMEGRGKEYGRDPTTAIGPTKPVNTHINNIEHHRQCKRCRSNSLTILTSTKERSIEDDWDPELEPTINQWRLSEGQGRAWNFKDTLAMAEGAVTMNPPLQIDGMNPSQLAISQAKLMESLNLTDTGA